MDFCNLFIFVGQFGNKIGCKLIPTLKLVPISCPDSGNAERKDAFIAVDTEAKAVRCLQGKAEENVGKVIFDKKGRGGNWSMGYQLQREDKYGSPIKEVIVRMVRRKMQQSSISMSFRIIIVHSLIGGTGGGLGSAILESLRDEFPTTHITSVSVAPFVSGESPLQHYNALLTLCWLQRYSDCVLLFHNDEVMSQSILKSGVSMKTKEDALTTLDDINNYICYNVAAILYKLPHDYQPFLGSTGSKPPGATCSLEKTSTRPENKSLGRNLRTEANNLGTKMKKLSIHEQRQKSSRTKSDPHCGCIENKKSPARTKDKLCDSRSMAIGINGEEQINDTRETNDILQLLTPNSKKKFVASVQKHSRRITSDFKPVLSSLLKSVVKKDQNGQSYRNSSVILIAYGECSKALDFEKDKVLEYLGKNLVLEDCKASCVEALASPLCISGYQSPLSLSLYTNTSRVGDFIEHVIHKASMLYDNNAYLHWYEKFGITKEYFLEAFSTLNDVVQEYRNV